MASDEIVKALIKADHDARFPNGRCERFCSWQDWVWKNRRDYWDAIAEAAIREGL